MTDAILKSLEEGNTINERLADAADEIAELFKFHTGEIRPHEAAKIIPLFVEMINLLIGLDEDTLRKALVLFREMDGEALGELLLAIPITQTGHLETIDQHLAVDVARVIGPDHAQNWYRFAVLMTKLA